MKKIIFYSFLIATMTFVACKKSNNDPATPEIAVADANGMIERFNFDGNLNGLRRANVTFSNPNNATVTGTDRRGVANRALVVPAGAGLDIANLPLVTGGGSRTMLCWVHPNNSTGNGLLRTFVTYGVNSTGQSFGMSHFNGNYWGSTYGPGNEPSRSGSFEIPANVSSNADVCYWVPVAVVYNQTTNKLTIYHWNTTNKTEITPSSVNTTGTNLRIGAISTNPTGSFRIDDLIIYNRALTEAEIGILLADGRPNCS